VASPLFRAAEAFVSSSDSESWLSATLRPPLSAPPALPLAAVVVVAFVPASAVALSAGGASELVAIDPDVEGAAAADGGGAVVDAAVDEEPIAEGAAEAGAATVAFTSGAAVAAGRFASLGGELRTA
jgi:hypothetical protein